MKKKRVKVQAEYPGIEIFNITKELAKDIVKWHLLVWVLLFGVVLSGYYSSVLVMMDIGIIVLFALHSIFVVGLMKEGSIKAYYRKDYLSNNMMKFAYIKHLVVFGAIIRIAFLQFMLWVVYMDDFAGFSKEWSKRTDSFVGLLLSVLIYLIYLYVVHYQDKSIRMDKFSETSKRV